MMLTQHSVNDDGDCTEMLKVGSKIIILLSIPFDVFLYLPPLKAPIFLALLQVNTTVTDKGDFTEMRSGLTTVYTISPLPYIYIKTMKT